MLKNKKKIMILLFTIFFLITAPDTSATASTGQIKTVSRTGYISDSLNGVNAIYRKGGSDGSSPTYSCAAYVKKYYTKVYGTTPYNLLHNATPVTSGDKFVRVKNPQVGDIVSENTNHGTSHWSIVKKVNGTSITLIEQNWKWNQSGKTLTKVNRTVGVNSVRIFRLQSENKNTTYSDSKKESSEIISASIDISNE